MTHIENVGEFIPNGIYAAVYVEPVEKKGQSKRFFDQFNNPYIRKNLAEGNLHVSAQYAEELVACGVTETENKLVDEAFGEVAIALADLKLRGVEFKVDSEEGVIGRKKWWTVNVAEDDEGVFNQARTAASNAVKSIINFASISRVSPQGYHIGLSHRGNAGHNRMNTRIKAPELWVITGVGVSLVPVHPNLTQLSRPATQHTPKETKYVNNPRAADRRKGNDRRSH